MNSSGLWIGGLFRLIIFRSGPMRRAVSSGVIVWRRIAIWRRHRPQRPMHGADRGGRAANKAAPPGPQSGPTFPQTLGAQLHQQPTPLDVQHAERVANKDGEAALEAAKKADAEGDAAVCNANLVRAKHLYDIDQ